MRRHNAFMGRRDAHRRADEPSEWRRQRALEEQFLRIHHIDPAHHRSGTLAAVAIVAAACIMVGSTHVVGDAADSAPPAGPVDCAPGAASQAPVIEAEVLGLTRADRNQPVRLQDFFKESRPRAASKGKLCEVANCPQLAFVSVRIAGKRRQVCLSHYEVLMRSFGPRTGAQPDRKGSGPSSRGEGRSASLPPSAWCKESSQIPAPEGDRIARLRSTSHCGAEPARPQGVRFLPH